MENEEVVDTTIENDDSQIVEEEQPEIEAPDESIPTVDDYNRTVKELADEKKQKAKIYARLKALEAKPLEKPSITNQELSPEEIRLIAKGVSDDDIAYLKRQQAGAKAMGESISLSKLYEEDPAFLALQEKRAKEERSKKSGLGGSGRSMPNTESPFKAGVPRDEHKKAFEQALKEAGIK